MIGLCGNMDGETVSELRDPQRCILSSGAVMAASYSLIDNGCSGLNDKIRGQLREEQNACSNKHDPPSTPLPDMQPRDNPALPRILPSANNAMVNGGSDCTVRRTLVLVRNFDDAKCFSTSTVKECRASCQGHNFRPTNVSYRFYFR